MDKQKRPKIYSDVTRLTMEEVPWTFAYQQIDLYGMNDLSEVDAGFYAIGSYADYKEVVKGKKDFIEGVMKGIFKIKGDMSKIMRNAKFIRAVANSISSFKATYLGE